LRWMVGLGERLNTPIQPGAKIILQIGRPASESVISIGGAIPYVGLVGPKVPVPGKSFIRSVPSSPASPGRLGRIVHSAGNEIKKRHRVSFFAPMSGVRGIKRAE